MIDLQFLFLYEYAEYIFLSVITLWFSFIALTRIVGDAKSRHDLNIVQRVAVIAFVILDVIDNFTVFAIIFWEWPDIERATLTKRLKHILHSGLYQEYEWRFKLARFMCKYMIEPWDFGHCALSKLKV